MAYYLTLDRKGKEPIILDINKSKYFFRISRYTGNKTSIEEMDLFTMMFNDEKDLRQSLILESIIPVNEWNRSISIRRKNGSKYDKVMYEPFYQKDLEYFLNPEKLLLRINNKLLNNDFCFIDEYVKHFSSFRECSSTLPEVRYANNESIRLGMRSHMFDQDVINGVDDDNLLTRMTKLLIYKHYQTKEGKVFYKNEIIYRNLHKILAFINNYDNKEKSAELSGQMNIPLDEKIKKRKHKKDPIEGQISLFD